MVEDKYMKLREDVEAIQPGAKIAVSLFSETKREVLQGEYVAMGEAMLLMVANLFTANLGYSMKVVSIPYTAIKHIQFPDIEVPNEKG